MVGIGTVLHDDPRLTVRHATGRDPLRVVIDRTLRTPPTAAVLRDGAGVGTWIVCAENAPLAQRDTLRATGATLIAVPEDANQHLDLLATLQLLATRGISSVMLEGGSRLITSMLTAQLIDRVAITVAPKLLGAGVAVFGDIGINSMAQALPLHNPVYTPCGADIWIEAEVRYAH
jgi:5-amino-6-(5-phosphoribosylamino)uracil reductase/diaminohydroxyphosphoribosylaminopyrimidine deaminase/5-amino-6-(5-phosphoribosylamino)uracil reductase